MIELSKVDYHPVSEKIVDILMKKTQNNNPLFFRVQVAYFLAKMAASMQTTIKTLDRGLIPINVYAINLAPSGFGKGHSTGIIENEIINEFRSNFMQYTYPEVAQQNIRVIAAQRAQRDNTDVDDEINAVEREFISLGSLLFSFSEGTSPAVKQMRHKILMAGCGAVNFEMDEMGSNLLGNIEVLNTFLELYDVGRVKPKLTKNTTESKRSEDIDGSTPTNMLLFGTPAKLLNGGKEEDEFYSLLETGFARRCFFGLSSYGDESTQEITPEEVFKLLTNETTNSDVVTLRSQFASLADSARYGQTILVSEEVTLLNIEYKLQCEKIAKALPAHEEIRKAEISHRYFKAMKLAGAYAFIDRSPEVTLEHLYAAIRLTEDSGEAFKAILNREKSHVKLARYIAEIGRNVTNADMVEELPFYPNTAARKNEMMSLARAWGYKNNIIIRSYFDEGIEFFSGEALQETNLNKLILSHSGDFADGYRNEYAPFNKLELLVTQPNHHFTNHHLLHGDQGKGHRTNNNIIEGFNMVVIDVDGTARLDDVQELLKEYTYLTYTTKSNTPDANRFRLILPINYVLKLDTDDFKAFMQNVYSWLPFEVDTATSDRCRKWATNKGIFHYNEGTKLLDALPFIPKTSRNEEYKTTLASLESLDNIERWFAQRMTTGQRNVQLFNFGMMLASGGLDLVGIKNRILSFNNKMKDKLTKAEIENTIMVSIANRIQSGNVKSRK